ncbi:MAG TPA: DNA mismatch repair endonuclease MutL [Verrucomicrobiae bacterium]|nr:DNA mismatch repair endonuclease MutL [Verrucomicrobiae bacterium]
MSSIRELDAVTVGQIAAGEIIERPVSVVKELVENAVDAGASRVLVAVERGGTGAIEVVDDGAGIPPSELPAALRRHATSKLADAADLASIGTLGFRGEGLASIAAVARVELLSREPSAAIGARVVAHAESIGLPEPAAAPMGTRVRAESLFENVPVRREYLRSPSAEFSRISAWLSSFALGYPHVAFTLRHDGKDVWVMPAAADPRERLAMVFGREAAAALIPLDPSAASMLGGSLHGFVSAPGYDRPDRRMQLLFVNGRLLRSTLLAGAWTAGYATYAMIGRHPYGVLMLDLPPDHVDPNVHPTKSDVRLRYASQCFDAVRRAIAATLAEHAAQRYREHAGGAYSAAPPGIDASLAHVASLFERVGASGERAGDESDVPGRRLRVLGQLDLTYILASDGESLLLVDQHAAHERIAYESIVARAQEAAPSEPLLVPVVVEIDAVASLALERALELLREGGLEIEAFGDRSYRIVATPAGYGARPFDLQGFLGDLTADPKQRDVRERIWASLACHSVTVAGERLELAEMTSLMERLQTCANPMHCPHGRPTMLRLTPAEIARMFKRV